MSFPVENYPETLEIQYLVPKNRQNPPEPSPTHTVKYTNHWISGKFIRNITLKKHAYNNYKHVFFKDRIDRHFSSAETPIS